jgi:hypothetical protein
VALPPLPATAEATTEATAALDVGRAEIDRPAAETPATTAAVRVPPTAAHHQAGNDERTEQPEENRMSHDDCLLASEGTFGGLSARVALVKFCKSCPLAPLR